MEKKKYIAFIGDSFCAYYHWDTPLNGEEYQGRVYSSTYTSIVGNHYRHGIAPYGFGGRSWWYSWNKFWRDWEGKLDQIEAIVFTHTNSDRINSTTITEFPLLAVYNKQNIPSDMIQANHDYFKYINDSVFNEWAQEQYFKMLKEKFNNIKTIHFHCYDNTVNRSHLLPGVVFTTPLMQLSVGEVRGSQKQVNKSISSDDRANHFNDHNNQVLADVIIQTLDTYTPGHYALPLEKFEQYNPNANQWPWGKYWTKG